MDTRPKTEVAFIWHMHQPFYKDDFTGIYHMPWVRLHAIKDYYPMAALVGRFPGIRATFNMVPVLMEQLNDYVHNGASDILLDLSRARASDLNPQQKAEILRNFFKANFKRFVEPRARYLELYEKKGYKPLKGVWLRSALKEFTAQDFLDLQVLFNLAWIHSIDVDEDPALQELCRKDSFTEEDKTYVLAKHHAIMSKILPLYRRLQDEGSIEVSTTPYYHPILPLVCDTHVARTSMPGAPLPRPSFVHPEDARWHIQAAVDYYTEQFGRPPRGMWPSEGSVSDEALSIMMSAGIQWAATDEDILFKSLELYDKPSKRQKEFDRRIIYEPYRYRRGSRSMSLVFRDKNLSDIISFNYNAWDQRDAADNLMYHFRNISRSLRREDDKALVTIVMDGENAWEYFEDNGRRFFETLYGYLENDPEVTTTTVSDYLAEEKARKTLTSIFPASWINHNFEIWIGQEQDNESWRCLSRVRRDLVAYEKRMKKRRHEEVIGKRIERAWREIHIAEGSDWNWWYGGKLRAGNDNPFDPLYRTHLKNVYKALKIPIPEFLKISIA